MTEKIVLKSGDRFGKLLLIKPGPPKLYSGKNHSTWECQCDCGNIKITRSNTIKNGKINSCGCSQYISKPKSIILNTGDKFGRLTVISYSKGKWLCQCDCGGSKEVNGTSLVNGTTRSCGCLKKESNQKNGIKLAKDFLGNQKKYDPWFSSAKNVYTGYTSYDKKYFNIENTLSMEEFLELSKLSCFYCGINPSRTCNLFKNRKKKSLPLSIENGYFTYNGLDRIDSNLGHTKENCVPCCYECNHAKRNRNVDEFINWIGTLQIIEKQYKIITLELPRYYTSSVNSIFMGYNDGDLTREEFECLSQYNCHYCDKEPSNLFNYSNGRKDLNKERDLSVYDFKYNGLDRINNDLPHNKDNVVPACFNCNWAKRNMSLDNFYIWIKRVQEFQNKKGEV